MAHPTLGGLHSAGPAALGLTSGCHVPGVPMTSSHSPPPPRAPQPLLKDTWKHVCASRVENERGQRWRGVCGGGGGPGTRWAGGGVWGGQIVEREKVTGLG